MSELLVRFDESIPGPDGRRYFAQAMGEEMAGGLWEGWLEFFLVDDSAEPCSSGRETTQPNRKSVDYWAQGLTRVYLEGAAARACAQKAVPRQKTYRTGRPRRASPAHPAARPRSGTPFNARPLLDPYAVYAQGEHILRSELGALSHEQVEIIATAYGFTAPTPSGDGANQSDRELVERVVDGVRSAGSR